MPVRIGSRAFAPRWFTSALTLVVFCGLIGLGRWQLHRAAEKRALFDAFAAGTRATMAIDSASPPVGRYRSVSASGHFDAKQQFLIENMTASDGRNGGFVITPFALSDGGWLLVNRGWVPIGTIRGEPPPIDVPADTRRIRGRVDLLPRPGIRLGIAPPLTPPFPIRATYPTLGELRAALGPRRWTRAAELVLLDPGQPDGFLRQWAAPGFPPIRHVGYAVQWFALAAALAVIYVVTNLRS